MINSVFANVRAAGLLSYILLYSLFATRGTLTQHPFFLFFWRKARKTHEIKWPIADKV